MNDPVEALRPCPFCNSSDANQDAWSVKCEDCGAEMPGNVERARQAWNRRAPVAGSPATDDECDCQCPEPTSGAALISETCPIHNHPHEVSKNRRLLGLDDTRPPVPGEGGKVVERLRATATERRNASASDENQALIVVAKISRADAVLMEEAAALIESLSAANGKMKKRERKLTEQLGEIHTAMEAAEKCMYAEDAAKKYRKALEYSRDLRRARSRMGEG